jgi:hypothetical protein
MDKKPAKCMQLQNLCNTRKIKRLGERAAESSKEKEGFMKQKHLQRILRPLVSPLTPVSTNISFLRMDLAAAPLDYLPCLAMLLLSVTVFLVGLLGILQELLLGLIHQTLSLWPAAFLQYLGQLFFPNATTGRPSLALLQVEVLVLCLIVALISLFCVRFSWRQLLRLIAYTRSKDPSKLVPPSQPFPFFPPGVFARVVTDLQEEEAFDLAKKAPDTWKAAIARIQKDHPQPPTPLERLQILMTSDLTINLFGKNSQAASLTIKHPRYAALVAYLAFQPRGHFIPRKIIMEQIYRGLNESTFWSDMSRIQADLRKKAFNAGVTRKSYFLPKGEEVEEIELFESTKANGETSWRLTEWCDVDVFPDLQKFFQRVKQTPVAIDREEQRKILTTLEIQYKKGQGLLGKYQPARSGWPWLREQYLQIRTQWLFLLVHAAQQEIASIEEEPTTPQDVQALKHAAGYYGLAALASSGIFSSLSSSEEQEARESEAYLSKSLHCYRLLQDLEQARALVEDYVEHRRRRDLLWKLPQAVKDEWPEAARQSRKKVKEKGEFSVQKGSK